MIRRFVAGLWGPIAALALALAPGGCDDPAPRRAPEAFDHEGSPGAVQLTLVLPAGESPLHRLWERTAMKEAGRSRSIFTVERPLPGDPPERQADLVRLAAERGGVLIVIPGDPDLLTPALREARDRAVPAIILGGPPITVDDKPVPTVAFEPPERPAKELVQALVEDARKISPGAEAPAVILIDETESEWGAPRVKLLKDALAEVGVKVLPDLRAADAGQPTQAVLTTLIHEQPLPLILLNVTDLALSAAVRFRHDLPRDQLLRLIVAGYADNTENRDTVGTGFANAIIDTNLDEPAREAVRLALALAEGGDVPALTEIPTPVVRAPHPPRPDDIPIDMRIRPRQQEGGQAPYDQPLMKPAGAPGGP